VKADDEVRPLRTGWGTPLNRKAGMTIHSPLHGLKVIDAATLFAGPFTASLLGDYGAEVIKIEHPDGDPLRRYGAQHKDTSLWWKWLGRNKKSVTLYLGSASGQDTFRRLAADADVVIENFRPGTMERWGLGYDTLSADNPGLVLTRVTGFGQSGPYASRPGFGTLAEAMSGLAAMSGEPDGPPMLPSFPLADSVAGMTAAFATMTALRARNTTGTGQVVDLAIIESMLGALGAQVTTYDQTGKVPERVGNRSRNNAPRGVYRCKDGGWVALSTPAQSVAERVVRLVGRPDLAEQPWFSSGPGRAEHRDELDAAVGAWVADRTRADVLAEFERANAAVAPIYDVVDVLDDPQYEARESIVTVDDPELGPVRMQNVPFRLSATPGAVGWAGPRLGQHNTEVLGDLGLTTSEIEQVTREGKS
jgi:crotonobetainyl-CoA:carnitine CoA-transferase CaiB-like acyl-CoA transferase